MKTLPSFTLAALGLALLCSPALAESPRLDAHDALSQTPAALRAAHIATVQRAAASDARFFVQASDRGLTLPTLGSWRAAACTGALRVMATRPGSGDGIELRAIGLRCNGQTQTLAGSAQGARTDPAQPNRVTRDTALAGIALREWYVAGPLGIEHGFDVDAPRCRGSVSLSLSLTGATASASPEGALLTDASGARYHYRDLHVVDATGRTLDSEMVVTNNTIELRADTAGAVWPIVVDPLLYAQTEVIEPRVTGDGEAGDWFGSEVVIHNNRAAISAPRDDVAGVNGQGSVYVYVFSGGAWTLEAKLTRNSGQTNQHMGYSLDMTSDTLVVGLQDGKTAYVYKRTGTSWAFEATLVSPLASGTSWFGTTVAVSGNFIAVGDGAAPGGGQVFVYARTGGTWPHEATLTASDGVFGDQFGWSVAMDGGVIGVGARSVDVGTNTNQGAAYAFARVNGAWVEQGKLVASDGAASDLLGMSIAVSGTTIVSGAHGDNSGRGAAYVFTRSGSTWSQQAKLTASDAAVDDFFGLSVSIDSDTVAVTSAGTATGATVNGAGYIYTRSGTQWSQQQKVFATQPGDGDGMSGAFGLSLAVGAERLLVGGTLGGNTFPNTAKGTAWSFTRAGSTWTQGTQVDSGDGADKHYLGTSVAISEDYALVGAPGDRTVYAYTRTPSGWVFESELVDAPGQYASEYGASVAVHGEWALVGAPGAAGATGRVEVYRRANGAWQPATILQGLGVGTGQRFGASLDIHDDLAVVGAPGKIFVYVFRRTGTTWTEEKRFTGATLAGRIGTSVAIGDDVVLMGEPGAESDSGSTDGKVHIYARGQSDWLFEQTLDTPNTSTREFGFSLALWGDTAVVGAPRSWVAGAGRAGRAYIYTRNNNAVWTKRANLDDVAAGIDKGFGYAVDIAGDVVLIGSPGPTIFSALNIPNVGTAAAFRRNGNSWSQVPPPQPAQPLARGVAAGDLFGASVAYAGAETLVGAPQHMPQAPFGNVFEGRAYRGVLLAEQGESCVLDAGCATGYCTDGVCCAGHCGGDVATDCLACVASLTGAADGTCAFVVAGSTCGAAPDGICDAQDTCDDTGVCQDNAAAAGVACGDPGVTACSAADSCDGAGSCSANDAANGSACDTGDYCLSGDTCAGGVCVEGADSPCADGLKCVETSDSCMEPCGDGEVDPGEACDDGGANSDTTPDACRSDCTAAGCGDGVTDSGEDCDDGNAIDDDSCSNACLFGGCPAGFAGPPGACVDVDECATGTDSCDANAACTNSIGSHTCACTPGFVGDGASCSDVDECASGVAACPALAACVNTDGSYGCECPPGTADNGSGCEDIDECALGTDACASHTACSNTDGSYTCTCPEGTTDDGAACVDIDECQGDVVCASGAECVNTVGGFDCVCSSGFEGPADGCEPICGDGLVVGNEACDDGETDGSETELPGCTDCQVDDGYSCMGVPSVCAPDLDGDGVADADDPDIDGDGYDNAIEEDCLTDPWDATSNPQSDDNDLDGDGVCDNLDDDSDGDLIPNAKEVSCGSDPLDAESTPIDTDGDGTCDANDADSDGDLWPDSHEEPCHTDPFDAESVPADFDDDEVCDVLDADDDNDGVLDSDDPFPFDASLPGPVIDADGDGVDDAVDNCAGVSNPAQGDSDGDGTGDACDAATGDDGCGCSTGPQGPATLLWLACVGLALLRRRSGLSGRRQRGR